MTRIDLHPEDLLDRAARGVASFADLARLEQHLAECAVCRVERALLVQAARDVAPLRDEKLLLARLTRDVNARLAAPTARRARRQGAFVAVAVLAVCLAGVAAAATLGIVRRETPVPIATSPQLPQVPAARQPPPSVRAPETEVAPPPSSEPSTLEPPSSEPPSSEPPSKSDAAPVRPNAVALEPASASQLFSLANQARRDGKVAEAARLYRSLQERFAGSSEELVSRVSLGRLLLDRLGDSRGALVQFNSYLASPGGGALREEAMVGRALALGRLGRSAEERAAWQALLAAWPKSTHRTRAQARLVELGARDAIGADADRPATGKSTGDRAQ